MSSPAPAEQLSELFGNYRAEWLRERIFDLFTQPSYFPDLEAPVPCVLLGGRGTGKTTALRSLSYEGRFALSGQIADQILNWDYYGFYYRVDTNRVTAFQGPELEDPTWTKLFGHYVNLLLSAQVLKFLDWYSLRLPHLPALSEQSCRRVAIALRIDQAGTVAELIKHVDDGRLVFEAYLNNLTSAKRTRLYLSQPLISVFSEIFGAEFGQRLDADWVLQKGVEDNALILVSRLMDTNCISVSTNNVTEGQLSKDFCVLG